LQQLREFLVSNLPSTVAACPLDPLNLSAALDEFGRGTVASRGDALIDYRITLIALALAGLLLVVQLIIADLTAMKKGHRAGYPIAANSSEFLFRSARAHANTNESISAFVLLALAGIFSSASPAWINGLSVTWLVCRVGHMGFYYADKKSYRSAAFGASLLALLGLFGATLVSWL
jgi:uncharacterized MAPEG superfamily protein